MNGTSFSVIVFGTFDGLHEGHRHFLREARALGTHLTVVLPPDDAVRHLKSKEPVNTSASRKKALLDSALVDVVLEGDHVVGTWKIFTQVHPDCIALGYDQLELKKELETFFGKRQSDDQPKLV
ncbi:MAG: adenylyltransferase/cytidyltransferase family protein, partial [Candidatus Taylorbacteria bacterium]|nr:adenylyltransferase/cytidyltransferase family protein [Candidatus Taylorbacteria bacterium]